MAIEQEFTRTADGTRLPVKDDIQVNFKLTENSKGLYARRLNIYTRHSFEVPAPEEAQVFRQAPASVTLDDAYRQTEDFWEEHRPAEAVRRNPNSTEKLMERLNSVRAYRWGKEIFSSIVAGYVPTHRNRELSKFDFGPVNSIVNHNTLEGMRFRVGGATTTALSRRWSFDGYVAYGVKDRKMKYDALAEYSFNDRKEFRKEFPVHSLRFEYMYDINKLGQNYMYTSKDNMMLMIRRKKDRNISYLRLAELTYLQMCFGVKDMTGSVLGAQEAFLVLRGLKTFELRMMRHCENARKLADYLVTDPRVETVYFPGVPTHPGHETAKKQMRCFGPVMSIEIKGGKQAGMDFVDHLRMCRIAVSLGDAETLVQHAASMTHSAYSPEELKAAGIPEGLVRISVGLENAEDIIADVKQALDHVK